jgi:hypothetical protein
MAANGIDVYVDHVGGEHLQAAIAALRVGGHSGAGRGDQRLQRHRAGAGPA